MKLVLAWTWLSLVGLAFIAFFIYMLTQIPLEVWIVLGFFAAVGIFFAITAWAANQIPGDNKD